MKTISIPIKNWLSVKKEVLNQKEKLLNYYEEAGPDYRTWSNNFNMHFGFYKKGMNPFRRESMLEMMNEEVLSNLGISESREATLVDMGCGLSATLRHATKKYAMLNGVGITLVPWQKHQADMLNKEKQLGDRITICLEDYTRTSLPDGSADFVIAMESSCYASGSAKNDLLKEIHRVLRPGGKFVIADGFVKSKKPMSGLLKMAYEKLCKSWALQELGNIEDVKAAVNQIGFSQLKDFNISWKVAPSVAHVPFTVIWFLLKQLIPGKTKMSKERWDNLISPLLTMVLGLHQKQFGYYLIMGTK